MIALLIPFLLLTSASAYHKPSYEFKQEWPECHVIPEPSSFVLTVLPTIYLLLRCRR